MFEMVLKLNSSIDATGVMGHTERKKKKKPVQESKVGNQSILGE